tara:strand:- start:3209 stop:3580 length:372 start_codon:yes stop_codon:yes gene_type:complete
MKAFDLKKALAGENVVTRDGRKVTQLVLFKTNSGDVLYGLDVENDHVEQWLVDGRYHNIKPECDGDLLMAPKTLGGFINVYNDLSAPFSLHSTKIEANTIDNMISVHRVALIDLSEFEEGHGL